MTAITTGAFCFAAGVGILTFCALCFVCFIALYLIDERQRKERSK